MPSPKGYKRDEVLDHAIELFRRQGYSATTTAELVDALGMNRKSMYAEFGSKQELFEAALERYSEINLTRVLAPKTQPRTPKPSETHSLAMHQRGRPGSED